MRQIACPSCGEEERLRGTTRKDSVVELRCEACGATWERDASPKCRLCGSDDLRYAPRPLWERGRGTQRTPAGRLDAYDCYACGGKDVTSARPGTA
jgi:predicted RNA-binding Zn-ribbon protein involved in translation (DUF1610 family)